ncbi:hypothetical protein [Tanticharoenia sakaeratensis]|uniref:Uncharacterized protein n=1 Tax=Tanticharoenia sakaeratensis NBRC 103193 TaxID=1231623 RepID=A0A0D6MQ98_9PROT|nr:hypothetical protein [Tanticharoenia sakaeratensis]GAN55453.1 hypothetical protein Tasa_048_078 [Tanticharoenia sakaeratensis NBRC 103193]GBQ22032.1 hypothetical protein AA103193_1933 [Tanticharoenia sakaeratensis NBRC 103193]
MSAPLTLPDQARAACRRIDGAWHLLICLQERADHIAEWVRITENKLAHNEPVSRAKEGRGNTGGVRAAVRELGIERNEAQRAVKIAGISEEARAAADEAGRDA